MPTYTLAELSELLGEPFEGDGSLPLTSVGEITAANEGTLSFVANPKYVAKIASCNASALIVPIDLKTDFLPVIRSANPYLTFTKALSLFHQNNRKVSAGVHPASKVSSTAQLGKDVTIMPHAIVEEGVVIGDYSVIYPGVYVGSKARIGSNVTLYPHVCIGDGCELGENVILHGGCRIGITSQSYIEGAPAPVILGDDVELGANVVVSGASGEQTIVGTGTKVDNLVQIGHGVQMGQHCIVVAQVTIGDHVQLGDHSVIAGQVVISPHLSVGARSRIGAKSVVQTDVPPDSDFWGDPAQPINKEKRLKANLARLPRLFGKIQSMEDALKAKKNS